jgi:predicted enzyme related to lactoylglutathione lyase
MQEFERLIGAWHGEGDADGDPPIHLAADATIEWLGSLLVFRTAAAEPPELPSSVSLIGGATEGEPQPLAYFDSRGVRRRYLTAIKGSTWRIWFAPDYDWRGADGPGFDQRFIGEIADDGATIDARWERKPPGATDWEVDFPMRYVRMSAGNVFLFGGIPVRDFAAALPWYRQLFGSDPTFTATETEAGWVLASQRSVYIEQVPERAGHAMNTILVADLDGEVARISARGLEPALRETYGNGVRKITYRDPDGNEFGLGELPG